MKNSKLGLVLAAPLLALAGIAGAQTSGGSSGAVQGNNVSAGTYGSGQATDTGTGIAGGGNAMAIDGSAATKSTARANERQAMQRSVATARSGDERARSTTRTHVLPNDKVKSRTMSIYKERGEKPVIQRSTEGSTPNGG